MVALPVVALSVSSFDEFLYYRDKLKGRVGDVARDVVGLGSFCVLAGYIMARTYLVVESFVSLRAEPISVFLMPR